MRKELVLGLATVLGPACLGQQTGQVEVLDNIAGDPGSSIVVHLLGCGGSIPKATLPGGTIETVLNGETEQVAVANSGATTFYVWPNDIITCGGVGGTMYLVSYFNNGQQVGDSEIYTINSGTSPVDLGTLVPAPQPMSQIRSVPYPHAITIWPTKPQRHTTKKEKTR